MNIQYNVKTVWQIWYNIKLDSLAIIRMIYSDIDMVEGFAPNYQRALIEYINWDNLEYICDL